MAYSRIVRDLEYQEIPVLSENQHICRNVCPEGGLLFRLQLIDNDEVVFVGQLPQKFDKKIMFGRGDLCICTINDLLSDEIARIDMLLTQNNIKELIKREMLPPSENPASRTQIQTELDWESSGSYY